MPLYNIIYRLQYSYPSPIFRAKPIHTATQSFDIIIYDEKLKNKLSSAYIEYIINYHKHVS